MPLRVVSGSYDITDDIEGLSWSSVNPGGDETCTFTLKRSWFADNPETDRGNLLRVMDGIDVLWQGRVEETDRGGQSTEEIGVTAYGLGARLKDTTMREIYVDRDLSRWGSPPIGRRTQLLGFGYIWNVDTATGGQELGATAPGLILSFVRKPEGVKPIAEMWLFGGGIDLDELRGDFQSLAGAGENPDFDDFLSLSTDDKTTVQDLSKDFNQANATNQSVTAGGPGRKYALVSAQYTAAGAAFDFTNNVHGFLNIRLFGRHGLTKQGSQPNEGFLISQMIADAIERATGITLRRLDTTSFICGQAAFLTATSIESVVAALNEYEKQHRTWGTWGPDSPLDTSEDGYFDYREIDTAPSWFFFREECDACNLHSETATLFDAVEVSYTDASGIQRTVTRTATVPDLNGIPRTASIEGGTLTQAGAETLGDAFLALSGNFAPARGSATLSQPIRHLSRGILPPHYMRADGSAIRIPDILPSSSAFALDSSPDRRTTFPIKQISVDAGDKATPVVTCSIDQTNDAISALQARLGLDAQLVGG